ncbi:glycosyl transferase [Actinotalea ferrariae CF5-4]|uniref:Glycosyl transferase n=1 Tax=Actinotalea ferrariae CF5-4 TaxID=948458 RepID=A0A021VP67_9CELL|nr:WecB/TagA/CpsF family glycosyltransferase [Actinotalea ferrariae]EYR62946.1 glycosyl transferase [Actinotalea ferrariae CF5-4]
MSTPPSTNPSDDARTVPEPVVAPPLLPARVPIGAARVHPMSRDEAAQVVSAWAAERATALVVTPNVDHLVLLEQDETFRGAYDAARLQLCDGFPLLVLARLSGDRLPERVAGADLFLDVCERAAASGHRVFVAGGMPDVLQAGLAALRATFPELEITGHSPPVGFEGTPAEEDLRSRIAAEDPSIVMVCLGAPRAEIWAAAQSTRHPAVYLCVGAAIDFAAGTKKRAPSWMQRVGLEWLYRLAQEPVRLSQRYLVRDRAIVGIAARHLRSRRSARSRGGSEAAS